MGGEEDSLFFAEIFDEFTDLKFLVGVEPIGRFIENENLGVMKEGLRETGSVPVSFGKGADGLAGNIFEEAGLD